MMATQAIERWRDRLGAAIESAKRDAVIVVEETTSTQDWARQNESAVGSVIVASRQTRGRGRLGRSWIDTGEDGVAMTLVFPAERSERLAIAGGLAAARAVENACAASNVDVRIKWPNDVMAKGRKIAGVLVECADGRALVGIGINVHQRSWPEELQTSAISLSQLGVNADRLQIMVDVLRHMHTLVRMSDEALENEFATRDMLAGAVCSFRFGEREIRGRVLRVDPMKGLAVLTESEGEIWLPAATTSVIKD